MTTYTWTISTVEHNVDDGGVIVAHWRVTAQDGEYSEGAYGSAGFTPDPASPSFKPYDQLTEADVLRWVWDQEDFDKSQMEANLAARIDEQKVPKTKTGVPWD